MLAEAVLVGHLVRPVVVGVHEGGAFSEKSARLDDNRGRNLPPDDPRSF